MFQQRITLPESHPDYPCVWQSECGRWRVISCVDDIQYIVNSIAHLSGAVRAITESGGVLSAGTRVIIASSTVRWGVGFCNLLRFSFYCVYIYDLNVVSYFKAA